MYTKSPLQRHSRKRKAVFGKQAEEYDFPNLNPGCASYWLCGPEKLHALVSSCVKYE